MSTVVKYVPNNCQRHFTLTNLVSMPQNLNVVKKKVKKILRWIMIPCFKTKKTRSDIKKNVVNGALEFYKNETPKLTLRFICNCAEAIHSYRL